MGIKQPEMYSYNIISIKYFIQIYQRPIKWFVSHICCHCVLLTGNLAKVRRRKTNANLNNSFYLNNYYFEKIANDVAFEMLATTNFILGD